MKFNILTLFPNMFSYFYESIIGRAINTNIIKINIFDIRQYSKDSHKKCDDLPYGGGAGMIMTAQPIYDCIKAIDPEHNTFRILTSARGNLFNNKKAQSIAQKNQDITIVCGHYEGVDERVNDLCIDEMISIGNYVLTGGELPAMVIVDAVSRFIPNVLGSELSCIDESFENNLLEYPQYTRPQIFQNLSVPKVLLKGNHKEIKEWRKKQSILTTYKNRKDLLDKK